MLHRDLASIKDTASILGHVGAGVFSSKTPS